VLVEVFKDEGKTVDIPKQLTVPMFSMILLQLLEMHIPIFLVCLVPDREFKSNLVERSFSLNIHSAIFEEGALHVNPITQLWVKAVLLWHIAYNTGRETVGVSVGVFKMMVKRSAAQNNSQ
jgi:hypothetical protein